jgi:hypothetical protein
VDSHRRRQRRDARDAAARPVRLTAAQPAKAGSGTAAPVMIATAS